MAKGRRDDFSNAVIRTLERRVNGRCSNPDHRVPTSGPTLNPGVANNIGVAAHISAASPGGPRYNDALSSDERKDISNGIWLCQTCSVMVDRDPGRYSVEVLKEWKRDAEQAALEELGNIPISRRKYEHLRAVVTKDLPKNYIHGAVSTICELSEQALEEVDPRFKAKISYDNGRTVYSLTPQEPVAFSAIISDGHLGEFRNKFRELLDHGRDLEVDSKAITITGSPLLAMSAGAAGKFRLSTNSRRAAIAKVSISDPSNDLVLVLDDVIGEFVSGAKSVTFAGATYQGLLEFEFSFLLHDETKGGSSSFLLNHLNWEGKSLLSLPYFDKIFRCFDILWRRGNVHWKMEVEGLEVMTANGSGFNKHEGFRGTYALLRYIRNSREILKLIGMDATFANEISVSSDELEDVEKAYCLLFEYQYLRGSDIGPIKFRLIPHGLEDPDGVASDLMSGAESSVRLEQDFEEALHIFGKSIRLPKISLCYSNVRRVMGEEMSEIESDEAVAVELHPTEDCEVSVELVEPTQTIST